VNEVAEVFLVYKRKVSKILVNRSWCICWSTEKQRSAREGQDNVCRKRNIWYESLLEWQIKIVKERVWCHC